VSEFIRNFAGEIEAYCVALQRYHPEDEGEVCGVCVAVETFETTVIL